MLLRNPRPEIAVEVGERVRRAVGALDLRRIGVPGVSVSVGVAVADGADDGARRGHRRSRPGAVPREARRARPGGRPPRPRPPGGTMRAVRPPRSAARAADPVPSGRRPRPPTTTWPGSSTRSATSSRSRARSPSRPSPTTARRTRSPRRRSTSRRAYAAGDRRPIPGVGKAIGDKIVEMATTGRIALHDRLRAEVPPGVVDLLRDPGRRARRPCARSGRTLGIDSMEDLRRAAEAGRAARPEGDLGRHRAADPRGDHARSRPPAAPPARPGAGDLGRARRAAAGHAGVAQDRAGRVAAPPPRDDRRPRPPRRDGRRPRPSSSGSSILPGVDARHRRRAARRRPSGSPAVRRWT